MDNNDTKKETFSKIYHEKVEKIYRFVYLKVSTQAIAQDITSEAFTRYWEQLCKNKVIDNPSAFLYRTAHNLLVDHYRKRGRQPDSVDIEICFDIKDEKVNIEQGAILSESMGKVKDAMGQLRDEWRLAISLYYIDKAPINEVAEALEKSEANTRVIIHRALKELRKILEKNTKKDQTKKK